MMSRKDIAIFGPYPPPLGGISVHVKRMEPFLKKKGLSYVIYNHGSASNTNVVATHKRPLWYVKLFFTPRARLFHFHQFFYFHFPFYFLFSLFRKERIFVTIHSERLLSYGHTKKKVALFFLSKIKNLTLISVSKNLKTYLDSKNIKSLFLPAYVPPISDKVKNLDIGENYFLFSVWKFTRTLAHEIYNVPLAFEFLRDNRHDLKMLFMIGNKKDSDTKYLETLIDQFDVRDKIELCFNENLVDYLTNCRFLLRPNLSDGYGVSVQEAMDMGAPAIASDVCARPQGSVLFKSDNINSLNEQVAFVLNTPISDILDKREELGFHLDLLDAYIHTINETSNTKL
ncbi:MAG: glycosyltransferase [Bacteroidota bacterium]